VIVFFDASALIDLIEGREPFSGTVRAELQALIERDPSTKAAVSRLSWLECRVGPMKDTFFARPDLIWVELTRDVVELAAAVRVRHGLRTPDALQAACCLQLRGPHVLFTGDTVFKRVAGLNVTLLA